MRTSLGAIVCLSLLIAGRDAALEAGIAELSGPRETPAGSQPRPVP